MMQRCDGSYRSKIWHCEGQIIILCAAWYTSFKLSLLDLEIMMADRGISVTHTTILQCVQHYLPEFEKRWTPHVRPVGRIWRMEETLRFADNGQTYGAGHPTRCQSCRRRSWLATDDGD